MRRPRRKPTTPRPTSPPRGQRQPDQEPTQRRPPDSAVGDYGRPLPPTLVLPMDGRPVPAREMAEIHRCASQQAPYFEGMRAALNLARERGIDEAEAIVDTLSPPAEPALESRIRATSPK